MCKWDVRFHWNPPPPLSAFVCILLDPPPSVRTSFMDDPITEGLQVLAVWVVVIVVICDVVLSLKVMPKRAQQWCTNKGNLPYFETSAKEALNVEQAFQAVARQALALETDAELYNEFPDQIRLSDDAPPQSSSPQCNCWVTSCRVLSRIAIVCLSVCLYVCPPAYVCMCAAGLSCLCCGVCALFLPGTFYSMW